MGGRFEDWPCTPRYWGPRRSAEATFGCRGFFFFLVWGLGHGKAFGRCVEARATIFCGAPVAKRFSSPRPPAYDEDGRSDGRKDNWEDWEDEEVVTPIMDDEQAPIADKAAMPSPLRPSKPTTSRVSLSRQSVHRLRRLKSRHRQRDQNAKAGIKVVTNMTELRTRR
ncbi:hypothetical protein HYQ46_001474 [Verticillium longisporum]|nr:hypothetical protein HYQ46_001474 [Verticillium longisporum]